MDPPVAPVVETLSGARVPLPQWMGSHAAPPLVSQLIKGSLATDLEGGYSSYHGIVVGGAGGKRKLGDTTDTQTLLNAVVNVENDVRKLVDEGRVEDFIRYWGKELASIYDREVDSLTAVERLPAFPMEKVKELIPSTTLVFDLLPGVFTLLTEVVDKFTERSKSSKSIKDEYKQAFDTKFELVTDALCYRLAAWWESCYNAATGTKSARLIEIAQELTERLKGTLQTVFAEVGTPGGRVREGTLLDMLQQDKYWGKRKLKKDEDAAVFLSLLSNATRIGNVLGGVVLGVASTVWWTAKNFFLAFIPEWMRRPTLTTFTALVSGEPFQIGVERSIQEVINAATTIAYNIVVSLAPSWHGSMLLQTQLGFFIKWATYLLLGYLAHPRRLWGAIMQTVNALSYTWERFQRWRLGNLTYDLQMARSMATKFWKCHPKYGCIQSIRAQREGDVFGSYPECKATCEYERLPTRTGRPLATLPKMQRRSPGGMKTRRQERQEAEERERALAEERERASAEESAAGAEESTEE
jgi:hypothetical protein